MISIGESREISVKIRMKDTSQRPVLVVPGMIGSTLLGSEKYTYPRLDATLAEADELKIFQGPWDVVGLDDLRTTLVDANYTVYETPWDWRMTLDETSGEETAWEKFLMEKIDEAKDPDGDGIVNFPKVDVVAHSMGGLLTRAYIQSKKYQERKDIDKFVMLGTPNEGSTKAYYLVHGGDPVKADRTVIKLKQVFTNATAHLMDNEGKEMYVWDWVCSNPYSCANIPVLQQEAIRDYYAEKIPTGRQLLPTYSVLDTVGDYGTFALSVEPNDFLVRLNDELATQTIMTADTSATSDKVRTVIFVSDEEATDGELSVYLPSTIDKIYPEGAPRAAAVQVAGDGTVTRDSAGNSSNACISGGGGDLCWAAVIVNHNGGEHSKMFGNFAVQVRDYLNEGRP